MIRHDVQLQKLNTFGLPSVAESYLPLTDVSQLRGDAFKSTPALVLGSGSNLLLRDSVPGLTVHVLLGGVEELGPGGADAGAKKVGKGDVLLRVGGGVDWNQLVRYTLDRGLSGMENLVLIPGTVGASPVQNIGAYGAEVANVIAAVHVWEYGHGARTLSPEACDFGYRDSRFKREPGRFLITGVDFRLRKEADSVNTTYGAINTELARLQVEKPTPADVALAVTNIRRSKLPDWFFLGNSGSFFKNPVVELSVLEKIRETHPGAPSYAIDPAHVKLPAGWLIDRSGLKGAREGPVGTYAKQALVMVNHGGATGADILAFSERVQRAVREKFGVGLEREVRLVPEE
ncbi:UDP-N-acetylmuramate dehydrogenase [Neolewinella antarctica]|uniref:UDP-N-acetylenolpyruvoylglucosamine reductase n=1 Tax=Neolewinella antarctica TaxID=442734 RepID=A0ABX0X9B1_9BACT|nr:UDP-N-acetylmuramate dehydrogenase [Neolewinella antarctica]NJC25549.1 UDP-N-acetylmuramate dehydrogenase [Neolewinella antarctica]